MHVVEYMYFMGCFRVLSGLLGGVLPVYFFKNFTYFVKNLNKIFGRLTFPHYLCRVLNDKIF